MNFSFNHFVESLFEPFWTILLNSSLNQSVVSLLEPFVPLLTERFPMHDTPCCVHPLALKVQGTCSPGRRLPGHVGFKCRPTMHWLTCQLRCTCLPNRGMAWWSSCSSPVHHSHWCASTLLHGACSSTLAIILTSLINRHDLLRPARQTCTKSRC